MSSDAARRPVVAAVGGKPRQLDAVSGAGGPTDAAWLIFGLRRKDRYGRTAWLDRQPIGLAILHEVLERSGARIGTCSPAAPHPKVVMVSLTSEHDLFAFYRDVSLRPEWQPSVRRFRVIAGGYGMQNPHPVARFVDYAFFGRAEDEIVQLLADNDSEDEEPAEE